MMNFQIFPITLKYSSIKKNDSIYKLLLNSDFI